MIKEQTIFLDSKCLLSERCYNILFSLNSSIYCEECKINKTKFIRPSIGYRRFCSHNCKNIWVYNNTDTKLKISNTVKTYHTNISNEERNIQQNKRLNTMVDRNLILDPKLRTDKEIYAVEVWRYTNKNNLTNLINFDKRGHIMYENTYQLDHKYSIHQGFIDCIPPWIIGSLHNLEMILGKENASKKIKCSINKLELINLFFNCTN
jgi:endogenous inhibitor of DNA gyrase (YacG/DUF329 family)